MDLRGDVEPCQQEGGGTVLPPVILAPPMKSGKTSSGKSAVVSPIPCGDGSCGGRDPPHVRYHPGEGGLDPDAGMLPQSGGPPTTTPTPHHKWGWRLIG